MKIRSWLLIVAVTAWMFPMLGCQPTSTGTNKPVAVSYKDFKIEIPPSFEGELNPDGMEVGLEVGNLAPDIEGQDLDGVSFKLSDYRGKVVVLDFWGDW
jgi:cytochrome oxidase Cu insertion factor (SCO1/SenC/PrrC family)